MAGIIDVVEIVNSLDYRPKYERTKCLRSLSPKAGCNTCEEICAKNSIQLKKNGITIDDSCNLCNECVSHCPTNALTDSGKKFVGAEKKIYLLCLKHELKDDVDSNFRIECINFLSTKLLLNIYNKGYREIHTNLSKCTDCERSHKLNFEINRTNKILSQLNKPLMSVKEESVETLIAKVDQLGKIKMNQKVDRRQFFKSFAKDIFGKAYEIVPPTVKLQYWSSTSQILEKWQKNEEKKLSLYKIKIDNNKCIQCKACMKMCPQNVWKFNNDDILFRPDLCNGCDLCKNICPTSAVDLEENIEFSERITLTKTEKHCLGCGKKYFTYNSESEKCPSCIWKNYKNLNKQ